GLKLGEGELIVATEEGNSEVEKPTLEEVDAPKPKRKSDRRRPDSDIILSAHYACTHCGLSFEPPSPQLFSFNSPQGMCPQCDGLGEIYNFDPELLVPDAKLSFAQGAIDLVGQWRTMGRWRRHIYQGVADTVERTNNLRHGTMLETPW